jgi:hypothetical protein
MIEGIVDAAELLRLITLLARCARSSQQQRSVTVRCTICCDSGRPGYTRQTTRGPGLRLAADSHVVEPSARPHLIADQRQIRGPWRRCRRLVRHQHRHGHVVEQLAADAAEQGLAKFRMVVGAGDDQIGVEIDGA